MPTKKTKYDKTTTKTIQRKFKVPQTPNQAVYLDTIAAKEVTICTGPAGCGKTALAVSYATQQLLAGKYKRIIITRPVVESGERLGFLPGDAADKLKPYLLPIYDEFKAFLSPEEFKIMCLAEQIEVAPLAYMRGRNFHESIIIADELQNGSYIQIKTLVTRLGMNSRMIMNGDMDQSDLPTWKQGGLQVFIDKLAAIDKIGIVTMTNSDIVRNPLITEILAALDGNGV